MKTERRQLHDWEKEECAALKRELDGYNARAREQKRKKLTQDVLAEELGMSQGTLSSHLNGLRPINKQMAAKMADILGIPVDAFSPRLAREIDQLAEMAKVSIRRFSGTADKIADDAHLSRSIQAGQLVTIPRYDIEGSMGPGILLPDHVQVIEQLVVSRDWLRDQHLVHTGIPKLAVTTGIGDSMKGTFSDGDPLLVDSGVNTFEADGIYFFSIDGAAHIKRLQRVGGGKVKVISDNPVYDRWEADLSQVIIHAKVLIGLNVRKME